MHDLRKSGVSTSAVMRWLEAGTLINWVVFGLTVPKPRQPFAKAG